MRTNYTREASQKLNLEWPIRNSPRMLVFIVSLAGMLFATDGKSAQLDVADKSDMKQYVTRHYKLHMLLINGTYLKSIKENSQTLIQGISSASFLKSKASESDNALAPCALLANVLLSAEFFKLERQIVVDRHFPAPIRGTNVFGMHDDDVVGDKFFKQPPEIKADILARMHILYSGGFDSTINIFIHDLTQQQCLDHLLITDIKDLYKEMEIKLQKYFSTKKKRSFFGKIRNAIKMSQGIGIHYAPVEMHGSTYSQPELDKYLAELKDPKSLDLSAGATTNPAMPCSLAKGYMSAAGVVRLWYEISEGKLFVPPANTPILGEYRELLKGRRIPTTDPVVAARITAGYFVNQAIYWDTEINKLVSQATQRKCLDEVLGAERNR